MEPSMTNPDVVERLTRMETKLDLWKESISMQMANSTNELSDHETRIRYLESQTASTGAISRWKATTGVAVVLALASLIPGMLSLWT